MQPKAIRNMLLWEYITHRITYGHVRMRIRLAGYGWRKPTGSTPWIDGRIKSHQVPVWKQAKLCLFFNSPSFSFFSCFKSISLSPPPPPIPPEWLCLSLSSVVNEIRWTAERFMSGKHKVTRSISQLPTCFYCNLFAVCIYHRCSHFCTEGCATLCIRSLCYPQQKCLTGEKPLVEHI